MIADNHHGSVPSPSVALTAFERSRWRTVPAPFYGSGSISGFVSRLMNASPYVTLTAD
jgi:hypothetical protein